MARHASQRQPRRDFDGPYIPLPRPRSSALPTGEQTRGWWVGGEWAEAQPEKHSSCAQRSRISPVLIDDGEDSDCYEVPPPAQRATHSGRSERAFDFNNSGHNVPWASTQLHNQRFKVRQRLKQVLNDMLTTSVQPRSFANSADDELLSYLDDRSISRGFLVEIDQFFRSHPEIADCSEGRETIMQLDSSSPLDAYRHFLRGYTRPAR